MVVVVVVVTNGAHHSCFSCECVKHVSWPMLPLNLCPSCIVFRSHVTGETPGTKYLGREVAVAGLQVGLGVVVVKCTD